ncbi:phosphoribosylanthranilate isomerase [Rossellomorea aquimaris]|uniref:N-(5'-phosphoribosyl)anthranilate isomerase n=1 Tax=Rossellomorea aquimaris TaxID=189382 RepID=A0A5D4TW24_9BACI|nr:phosphoribosylanthranilate isomerase [Rossellomorea aquimaris]TYS75178.1 phosphoribosylanthranilate isomerase [Rossellomorea aquimaris]TYS79555.1 phosphoribosylanthranilate isomerase [Rossellomorea aquimaris]
MTRVKVCGIRRQEEAQWALEAGADAIGFVFADSKRKIDVESAALISASLPSNVLKIGVFVNEAKDKMEEISRTVNLDYVQLHGDESVQFCDSLNLPFIKAVSIKEKEDLDGIEHFGGEMILVDSGNGPHRGGNGTTFNWDYVHSLNIPQHLILAGGLNLDNIRQAITKVRPYMVDVSSGVETDGKKDRRKIETFIREAKSV